MRVVTARAVRIESDLERAFVTLFRIYLPGVAAPVREYAYAKNPPAPLLPRRFRADFAFMDARVLVEMQGGIWTEGGHSTGKGLLKDYEKHRYAAACGWRVFCIGTGDMEKDPDGVFDALHVALTTNERTEPT